MYRTDFWTLWEKVRVGCFERTASKHVYYRGWNRSPAQFGCMRQVLRAGSLGRPRGKGCGGRREGWSGWGIHVNPWLIHVNVWQKPLQYCKVISLQLIKINGKKFLNTQEFGCWHLFCSALDWERDPCAHTALVLWASTIPPSAHRAPWALVLLTRPHPQVPGCIQQNKSFLTGSCFLTGYWSLIL